MSPPVQPERVLGRYALYGRIGQGGMAAVHLGRLLGPAGFSRTVAIKRLHDWFACDPEFVSMFLDEARLAARVQHPNVVGTLDVVARNGELFIVMEYVHGESLAQLLRATRERDVRVPPPIAGALAVGVLHGLQAAHEAKSERGEQLGIVHRDVSPQNVLIGTDGLPRIIDFGIAKAAGRAQTTQGGKLKGKLAYMAPEQIRGQVDQRTDIYAASLLLWEMLSGHHPFRADQEAQVLHNALAGVAEPPSAHAPGIPRDLDEAIMRGLALDPRRRFSAARDMARAIEATLPLASSSAVSEWVVSLAGEALSKRAARVARVESSSDRDSGRDAASTRVERRASPIAHEPTDLPTSTPSSEIPSWLADRTLDLSDAGPPPAADRTLDFSEADPPPAPEPSSATHSVPLTQAKPARWYALLWIGLGVALGVGVLSALRGTSGTGPVAPTQDVASAAAPSASTSLPEPAASSSALPVEAAPPSAAPSDEAIAKPVRTPRRSPAPAPRPSAREPAQKDPKLDHVLDTHR